MALNKNLTKLSTSERWWLNRKMLGMTQQQFGLHLKCGRTVVSERETFGSLGEPPLKDCKDVVLLLKLLRRRIHKESHTTLPELARTCDLSHTAYLQHERLGDSRLVALWRRRGWKFPRGIPGGALP